MAFEPMRTALLVVLVIAVAIAAALKAPLAGAKAKVSIHLSPSPAGVRVEVESTTSRPLVLFIDGHRVSSRTGTDLTVTVPLRFVSLDSSQIVVRDGTSRSVLASQTFSGRYFLKPRAPRLALTATPMGPTTARTATITWRTNGGRTSCAIDGRAPISCASPLRLDGLDLGRHDVNVTVFAHNSESSVRAIWTVRKEPARYEALRRRQHPAKPAAAKTKTETTTTATTTTTPTPPPPSAPPTTTAATTTATTTTTTVPAAPAPPTTTAATTTAATTTTTVPAAYLFDDEFNGSSIDASKWTPNWFGGVGPVNSAEAAGYSSSHLSVGGGYLSMTLTEDPIYSPKLGKTLPYTGALLTTQPSGQFKVTPPYRIEARMYLPASAGQVANWPAFWSNGNSWPTDGENDVMEGLGGDACWHYHSPSGGPGACAKGDFSGWHTFASEVKNGVATYYYDGIPVGTITQGVTTSPHYLILQQTISDHHPETAVAPATVLVDWIRVTPLS